MDSSDLPIPIGGSAPLSSVLLQLSAQGLRLVNVSFSPQTREASFTPHETELMTNTFTGFPENGNKVIDFSHQPPTFYANSDQTPLSSNVSFGVVNTGISSLVQKTQIQDSSGNESLIEHRQTHELQNYSTKLDQQKTIHQNDCQLLLNSVRNSFDPGNTNNQNGLHNLSEFMRNPTMATQIQPFLTTQPRVQEQVEEPVLPEEPHFDRPYIPGIGVERMNQYISEQRNRPKNNNIHFWRDFVAEFFSPGAKKRWCVSMYKNVKQVDCIFSKVGWQCHMCNEKPCRGFEIAGEVMPRLHKMKYDIGLLDEYLHLDTPSEYQDASGQIILDCPNAIEETDYEQVQIVRRGHLRVIFSEDLKICSWEFCAQLHDEYISRKSIIPQVCQLGTAARNYQLSTQGSLSVSPAELQKNTDMLFSSAYQMVEVLGMPFMSQIGIVKRYIRCLQISDVLNIMDELIDYSQKNGMTPTESMAKFPRFGPSVSSPMNSDQQPESLNVSQPTYFPASPDFGNESSFCSTGLGNAKISTSIELNNKKKQRTGPNCAFVKTPAQTTFAQFSTMLKAIGKSGEELAAENENSEPKTSMALQQDSGYNKSEPNNSPSTVEQIIQEVMSVQPSNKSAGTNRTEMMSTDESSSSGKSVASDGIEYINVRNNEGINNGIGFSGPAIGMTLSAQPEMDMFYQDNKSNYLPEELDDHLEDYVGFERMHELLKYNFLQK